MTFNNRRRPPTRKGRARALAKARPKKPTRYKIADMAYKGYKLASALAQTINTEFKYFDTEASVLTTLTSAGVHLNPIPQGDTAQSRDGNTARMKSLQFNFRTLADPTVLNSNVGIFLRLVLFLVPDPEPNTIYGSSDVLQTANVLSPRNLHNRGDVIILKDWLIRHDNASQRSTSKEYYKELDLKSVWNNTGTGSTIEKGYIGMIAFSNSIDGVNVDYYSRVRYIDN